MSIEPIVLAVASAVRPAALAAVYALVSRNHPRRLLVTYIAAGFVFSAAIGIVLVAAFHEADLSPPRVASAIFDLVVGAAALGFAAGIAAGRGLRRTPDDPAGGENWALRRLHDPTLPVAAMVGVATHLPGLFYLLALNAIIAERQGLASDIAQVLIYNAIWFGVSVTAVFLFFVRPSATKDAVGRLNVWARGHDRPILFAVFSVVGVYLLAHGIDGLAS